MNKLTIEKQNRPMFILTKHEHVFGPDDILDPNNVTFIRSHGKHQHLFKIIHNDKILYVWTHAFPYTGYDVGFTIPMPVGNIIIDNVKHRFLYIVYGF